MATKFKPSNLLFIKYFGVGFLLLFGIVLSVNIVLNVFNLENVLKVKKVQYKHMTDMKNKINKSIGNEKTVSSQNKKKLDTIKTKINDLHNKRAEALAQIDMIKKAIQTVATGGSSTLLASYEGQLMNSEAFVVAIDKEIETLSKEALELEKDYFLETNIIYDENQVNWQFLMSLAVILEKKKNPLSQLDSINEETVENILNNCLAKTEYITYSNPVMETNIRSVYSNGTLLANQKIEYPKTYKVKNIKYTLKPYKDIYTFYNLTQEEIYQLEQSLELELEIDYEKITANIPNYTYMEEQYIKGKMSKIEEKNFFNSINKVKNIEMINAYKPKLDLSKTFASTNEFDTKIVNAIEKFIELKLTYFPTINDTNSISSNIINYKEKENATSYLMNQSNNIDTLIYKYLGSINSSSSQVNNTYNFVNNLIQGKLDKSIEKDFLLGKFDINKFLGIPSMGQSDIVDSLLSINKNEIAQLKKVIVAIEKYRGQLGELDSKIIHIQQTLDRLSKLDDKTIKVLKQLQNFPNGVSEDYKAIITDMENLPLNQRKEFLDILKGISSLDNESKKMFSQKLSKIHSFDVSIQSDIEKLHNKANKLKSVQDFEKMVSYVEKMPDSVKKDFITYENILSDFPSRFSSEFKKDFLEIPRDSYANLFNLTMPNLVALNQQEINFVVGAIKTPNDLDKFKYNEAKSLQIVREMIKDTDISLDKASNITQSIMNIMSFEQETENVLKLVEDISTLDDKLLNQFFNDYKNTASKLVSIPQGALYQIKTLYSDIVNVPVSNLQEVQNTLKMLATFDSNVIKDFKSYTFEYANIPVEKIKQVEKLTNNIVNTPLEIQNLYVRNVSNLIKAPQNAVKDYISGMEHILSLPQAQLNTVKSTVSDLGAIGTEASSLVYDLTGNENIKQTIDKFSNASLSSINNFLGSLDFSIDSTILKSANNKMSGLTMNELNYLNNVFKSNNTTDKVNAVKTLFGEQADSILAKYNNNLPTFLKNVGGITEIKYSLLGQQSYKKYYSDYEKKSEEIAMAEYNRSKDTSLNNFGFMSNNRGCSNYQMVQYIYESIGLKLPSNAKLLFNSSKSVRKESLKIGDIAFKDNPNIVVNDNIGIFIKYDVDGKPIFLTFETPFTEYFSKDNSTPLDYSNFKGKEAKYVKDGEFYLFKTLR